VKIAVVILLGLITFVSRAEQNPFVNNGVFVALQEDKVTLQCEDIRLGVVLQTLAEQLQVNLLLTDPLEQPVSMNVRDVPKNSIVNNLLEAYGLKSMVKNNLTVIMPNSANSTVTQAKTFLLNYAKAQDVAETLKPRLNVSFDLRTNALIVYDAQENLDWLTSLLSKIDIPAKQVYIEATIMNASAQFSKELGLRFYVDEFSIATLPKDIPLSVAIDAAQENHQTRVIANPKLLTINLQEAHIKQGKQLAYQETSANGATSLTFQEAALELKVIPMITPEHDILLDLLVKQDVVGNLAINGQPTIDTKSIQAMVRVKDGETIVLGGIYSEVGNRHTRLVPGLSQIPLLGRLFKDFRHLDDNDELLIFVTPRVVL
jgi:type IV pilus assembly protein PilQ